MRDETPVEELIGWEPYNGVDAYGDPHAEVDDLRSWLRDRIGRIEIVDDPADSHVIVNAWLGERPVQWLAPNERDALVAAVREVAGLTRRSVDTTPD